MYLDISILCAMIAAGLWTVMTRSLLRSAIGLALTSALLAIVIFRLNSPLAAVFELSVCAGLISVLFISTISLTQPLTQKEVLQNMKERLSRFKFLPFILIAAAVALNLAHGRPVRSLPAAETVTDVRVVLWGLRQFDILGQVIILLTGAFGVVVLFKEER